MSEVWESLQLIYTLHQRTSAPSIPRDNHSWNTFDGLHFKFDLLVTTFAVDLAIFHCTSHRRRHSTIHNTKQREHTKNCDSKFCARTMTTAVQFLFRSLRFFRVALHLIPLQGTQRSECREKIVSSAKCDWLGSYKDSVQTVRKKLFSPFSPPARLAFALIMAILLLYVWKVE